MIYVYVVVLSSFFPCYLYLYQVPGTRVFLCVLCCTNGVFGLE